MSAQIAQNVDFTKVFRYAVQGVVETAKYMDRHIDPCCDAILKIIDDLLEQQKGKPIKNDEDRDNVKANIRSRLAILYDNLNLKITHSKEQKDVHQSTPYIAFVSDHKKDFAGKPFAEVGKSLGEQWKALSADEKAEYANKAAEDNKLKTAQLCYVKDNKQEVQDKFGKINKTNLAEISTKAWATLSSKQQKELIAKAEVKLASKKADKPKKEVHTCNECDKQVRSEPVDGVYLCAEHKKKPSKPVFVCSHIKKNGMQCSTQVKEDGGLCSEHKKQAEKKAEKKAEPVEEKEVVEEKKEKKEKKNKEESKKTKYELIYDFENQPPMPFDDKDNEDFWDNCSRIPNTEYAYQRDTNLVFEPILDKDEEEEVGRAFIGIIIKNSAGKREVVEYADTDDFPQSVVDWATSSCLKVKSKKGKKEKKEEKKEKKEKKEEKKEKKQEKKQLALDSDDEEECELSN